MLKLGSLLHKRVEMRPLQINSKLLWACFNPFRLLLVDLFQPSQPHRPVSGLLLEPLRPELWPMLRVLLQLLLELRVKLPELWVGPWVPVLVPQVDLRVDLRVVLVELLLLVKYFSQILNLFSTLQSNISMILLLNCYKIKRFQNK